MCMCECVQSMECENDRNVPAQQWNRMRKRAGGKERERGGERTRELKRG